MNEVRTNNGGTVSVSANSKQRAGKSARILSSAALAVPLGAIMGMFAASPTGAVAATYTRANTPGSLNDTNWTPTGTPGSADIALFNNTITGAQSDLIGGTLTLGELQITNPGGAISISGDTNTLTLNGVYNSSNVNVGIDMSAATQNLSFASTDSLSVANAQTWAINTGRTLTISSALSGSAPITISGGGTVLLNTTADTYTGSYIVGSGATLNLSIGQAASASVILYGGELSLSNAVALTATNNIYVESASTFVSADATVQPLFYGNANLNWATTTTTNTPVYNGTASSFSNFGGTVNWGANSNGVRIVASTGNVASANPFANFNLGSGTAQLYTRNGTETISLGGLQSTGTGTGIGGAGSSGGHDNLWVVGGANIPSETLAGGIFTSAQAPNSFLKTGTGMLAFTGISTAIDTAGTAGAAYQAPATYNVYGGTLQLNFSVNTANLLPATTAFGFGQGGTLALLGNSSTSSSQTFAGAGTTLVAGGGHILMNANGAANTLTLNLANINTSAGVATTLDISTTGAGTDVVTTTTAKGADGAYGARITYGNGYATTVSATSPYTLSTYTPGTAFTGNGDTSTVNYQLTGAGTVSAATDTVNSLTISSATGSPQTLHFGANTLTLTNGGLLYNGSDSYTIQNGTLTSNTATNSDLVLQQLGSGNLTINAVIANGNGASTLTKAGSGALTLGGSNTYTGATYLEGGVTTITSNANLGAVATGANLNLDGGTLAVASGLGSMGLYNGTLGTNNRAVVIAGSGGTLDVGSGTNFTIGGVISNTTIGTNAVSLTGSLTKTDSGTLTLANAANTYTGATVIDGGTVVVGTLANGNTASSIGAAPSTANALILNGGILQYTGAAVSTDRTFTVGTNGATLDSSGSGALNFTNAAPIAANNSWSGAGTRTLTFQGSFDGGSAAATNIFAGQIVDGTASTSVVKTGPGTWTFTNPTNTYTGKTTISQGTLYLANAMTSNPISSSGTITVSSGTTLNVAGLLGSSITLGGTQTLTGSGTVLGAVATSSSSTSMIAPGTMTSGLAGAGTLTVGNLTLASGSSAVFGLSSANLDNGSNSGNTTAGASIVAAQALTLPGTGTVTVQLYQPNSSSAFAAPGTYDLFSATDIPSIASAVPTAFSIGSATDRLAFSYAFGTSGNDVTVTLTQNATAGQWILNGNGVWDTAVPSNWTGGVPHAAGDTATFGTDGGLITVSPIVTLDQNQSVGGMSFSNPLSYTINSSGGVLTLDNKGSGASVSVTAGTANVINAPVSLNDNIAVSVVSGSSLAFAGTVSNTGAVKTISLSGTGTLALSGANTYGPAAGTVGTVISGTGTLQVGGNSALGAGDLSVAANGTLQAGAAGLNLANNIVISPALTATIDTQAYQFILSGIIGDNNSGTGAINKIGSGTLVLDNNETYGGATTISSGALQLGNADATGSVAGNIVDNAALLLNRTDSPTIANVISGSGNLTQNGTGNITLTGSNTFTGNTVINAGTLTLGNAVTLQDSTLNYNNPAGTLSFGTLTAATLGGLTGNQPLALLNTTASPVTLTIGNNSFNNTYSGSLMGAGSLIKLGSGTQTLSGSNSYTGTTLVEAGTLNVTDSLGSANTPTGAITTQTGGTLSVAGGSVYATSLTLAHGSGEYSFVTLTGNGILNISGDTTVNSGTSEASDTSQLNLISGTATFNSLEAGRTGDSGLIAIEASTPINDDIYVDGATVTINTTLGIGTASGTDSSAVYHQDAGTVTVGGTTIITNGNGGRYSILDVNGGTFTSNDTTGNGIQIGGVFSNADAELLVRGTAIVTANTITFGDASQSNGSNVLELLGGSLYVGSGGIVENAAAIFPVTPTINFGGTAYATAPILAATAPWTTALNITLTNSSSGLAPILQSSNSSGGAESISLTGNLNGSGGLNITGTGVVTLAPNTGSNNSYTGLTNVSSGTLVLANSAAFPSGNALAVNTGGTTVDESNSLLGTAASINLNGNLIVQGGASLAAVTAEVKAGYANGTWNGSGPAIIGSTFAAADTSHLHAVGVIQNDNGTGTGTPLYSAATKLFEGFDETDGGSNNPDNDILVKYTYYGDTNLDGKVDGTDYSRVDAAYEADQTYLAANPTGTALPATGWFNGDFNYDGVIDGSDYTLMDNAFNSQGAVIQSEIATATDQIAGAAPSAAVPEPTSLALLGIGAMGLLGRRNRRRR